MLSPGLRPVASLPWPQGPDWRVLERFPVAMARYVGDRSEWVIGIACSMPRFRSTPPDPDGTWWCGHLRYEHPNGIDTLAHRLAQVDGFPLSAWWQPERVVHVVEGEAHLYAEADTEDCRKFFSDLVSPFHPGEVGAPVLWRRTTGQDRYLAQLGSLLQHIHRGDIYEVNHCTERTATIHDMVPGAVFARLLGDRPAPFATFYKLGDRFAIGASPERFLALSANGGVRSQPMKGTRPRDIDPLKDAALAEELAADPKERSENVMAVDVARHDLGRVAVPGSVRVEQLCAVYAYPKVHQMVSTVRAQVLPGTPLEQVVDAAFPMASMTGAPKLRAMQLIDATEDQPRGLFSGTVGFIRPDGTADLNVVIRTITYDAGTGRASLITGGAITAASDPLREWEECELKARSVLGLLGHEVV